MWLQAQNLTGQISAKLWWFVELFSFKFIFAYILWTASRIKSLSLSYFQVNYLCCKLRNVSVCKFYDSVHAWGVSAASVYKLLFVIRVGTRPVDIVPP